MTHLRFLSWCSAGSGTGSSATRYEIPDPWLERHHRPARAHGETPRLGELLRVAELSVRQQVAVSSLGAGRSQAYDTFEDELERFSVTVWPEEPRDVKDPAPGMPVCRFIPLTLNWRMGRSRGHFDRLTLPLTVPDDRRAKTRVEVEASR